MPNNTCYWFNSATAGHGAGLPSGIKDSTGSGYWTYTSRLLQAAALDEILHSFAPSNERELLITNAKLSHMKTIYLTANIGTRNIFCFYAFKIIFKDVVKKLLPKKLINHIKNLLK